jgi:DNA-directed RNA polymerase subunit A"
MWSKNIRIFSGNTNSLFSSLMSKRDDMATFQASIAAELKDKTVLYTKDIEQQFKTSTTEMKKTKKKRKRPSLSVEEYLNELVMGDNARFTKVVSSPLARMVIFFAADIPWAMSVNYPLSSFREFVGALLDRSESALITSGDMVGIIAAQSCSERFTQSTLNSFHVAGMKKSAVVGIRRIEDILDGRKSLNVPLLGPVICSDTNDDPNMFVEKTMNDYCDSSGVVYKPDLVDENHSPFVIFFSGINNDTWERILQPNIQKQKLFEKLKTMFDVNDDMLYFQLPRDTNLNAIKCLCNKLSNCVVTGIPNCIEYDDEDDMLVFSKKTAMVKQGKNASVVDNAMLLDVCPSIDLTKLSSNDIYYIESVLGISAAETFIFEELKKTLGSEGININDRHIQLIAANMTSSGGIAPNTFSGVDIDNSVILKATFQQSTKTFAQAAAFGITDELNDVSAQILMGAKVRIGTELVKTVIARDVDKHTQFNVPLPPSPAYHDGTQESSTPEYVDLPNGYNDNGDYCFIPASPSNSVGLPQEECHDKNTYSLHEPVIQLS